MKLIALIDDNEVIEKILRHLKLWPEQTAPACLSRAPPPAGGERIIEHCFEDPFPTTTQNPLWRTRMIPTPRCDRSARKKSAR